VRALGWALKGGVAVVLAIVVVVGASAALDRPARSAATTTLIEAPREEVWSILMDFDSYPRWNPYMRTVRGRAAAGATLEIRLRPPGGSPDKITAEIFTYKPPRKLRWQSRLLVPGLRDLEYELIVTPLGPRRSQVVQRARYEGVLALFGDAESTRAGLESMVAALKRRAEART